MMNKKILLYEILQSTNTLEKVIKFQLYKEVLGDCKIFLFDEEASNVDESFENFEIGKCGIYGMGDYTKTWIIDACYPMDKRYIPYGKSVDFDLNVFSYLNRVMRGKNISKGIKREDVIDYFNYIKENGFQFGIASAIIERAAKPIKPSIWVEMLMSFVRYEKVERIDIKYKKVHLNFYDFIRVADLYRITYRQRKVQMRQYDAICCLVMKAYLIKKYDKDIKKRVENLIYYSLRVLNCYFEKEIVLLSLFLMDDERTKETFKKLNKTSKILENIMNIAWDIYHIRIIEEIMFNDNVNKQEKIILSYFATADKGLADAMKINPLKAFVIWDNFPIPIHSVTIEDVCSNENIMREISEMAEVRKERVEYTNYSQIKKQLQKEIEHS
ncbi:MAG: hypothetical protein J6J79_01400 [Lachnospiraceae bacterium]|nr:hypothetical protein [Lachnospiraceae bacterium]